MAGTWESFDALFDGNDGERSRKRSRTTTQGSFNTSLRALPHQAENIPEMLEREEETTGEQHVAEVQFFNQRNTSFWTGSRDLSYLRPFDFPYVRSLIQAPPNDTLSPEDVKKQRSKGVHVNIEVVTRKYEEQFLVEPTRKERRCAMDSQCQGLCIPNTGNDGFILKEFLLPSEMKTLERTGKLPKERRLCLMCKRKEVAQMYINVRADGVGCRKDIVLQDYRNLVNVEGEYHLHDTILSSESIYQGILDPIVLHTKTSYRIAKNDAGKRYFDQWKLKPFLTQRPEKTKAKSASGRTAPSAGTRRRTRSMTRQ